MSNRGRTAQAQGHIWSPSYSSAPQQGPQFSSYIDHGSHQQQGPTHVDASSRFYPTLPGDHPHGIPIAAQQNESHRPPFGPPSYTTPHTSRGSHIDHVSRPAPEYQRTPSHRVPQQMPPLSPYSQAPSMMNAPVAYDAHGRRDMGTFHGPSGQHVFQAVRGSLDNPTTFPQQRARNWPCLAPGCLSSFDRPQERRRHLLTHLPHWLHCPYPGCCWRGDRLDAFRGHWVNYHPPSGQDLDEGQFKTYDPWPLIERIEEGSLSVEGAKNRAMTMVREKASELGKQELWDNPWGRRERRRAQPLGYPRLGD